MRATILALVSALAIGAASSAQAHAFLDRASPAVGSAVPTSPPSITLWFTQDLEPAFQQRDGVRQMTPDNGSISAMPDPAGRSRPAQIALKPLPPGTYTVSWHVISVDTHPTEGTFTFTVGGG